MVEMNWFQTRFCSFVTLKFALWSRCMFQQESGHGIMWAYNNADAMAGFILILTVKRDLTERRLWSKCKACLDSSPRRQCSLNYCCGIWVWAVWLTTVLLWQTSLWTAALDHVDTFVWCSGFCERTFVSTDKQDLSSTTDVPVPQFGFTHSVSSPSLEFLAVPNTLTENVLLYFDFEQSAQTNCTSFPFFFFHYHQGSTTFCTIFHLPQSLSRKRAGSMKVKQGSKLHRETC